MGAEGDQRRVSALDRTPPRWVHDPSPNGTRKLARPSDVTLGLLLPLFSHHDRIGAMSGMSRFTRLPPILAMSAAFYTFPGSQWKVVGTGGATWVS